MNSSLCTGWIIKTDKSKALALVGGAVNEDLAADNIAKGEEHLHQLSVSKLLRQVVDEEITSFRATQRTACGENSVLREEQRNKDILMICKIFFHLKARSAEEKIRAEPALKATSSYLLSEEVA